MLRSFKKCLDSYAERNVNQHGVFVVGVSLFHKDLNVCFTALSFLLFLCSRWAQLHLGCNIILLAGEGVSYKIGIDE